MNYSRSYNLKYYNVLKGEGGFTLGHAAKIIDYIKKMIQIEIVKH